MIDIPSHNNIEERIEVARKMKEEMEIDSNIEVLVDNMEDEFNNMSFNDRIAVLSMTTGVEKFRWEFREPLWPDTPPWHSSPSSSSPVACQHICSSSDSSVGSSYYDSEIDSDECFE